MTNEKIKTRYDIVPSDSNKFKKFKKFLKDDYISRSCQWKKDLPIKNIVFLKTVGNLSLVNGDEKNGIFEPSDVNMVLLEQVKTFSKKTRDEKHKLAVDLNDKVPISERVQTINKKARDNLDGNEIIKIEKGGYRVQYFRIISPEPDEQTIHFFSTIHEPLFWHNVRDSREFIIQESIFDLQKDIQKIIKLIECSNDRNKEEILNNPQIDYSKLPLESQLLINDLIKKLISSCSHDKYLKRKGDPFFNVFIINPIIKMQEGKLPKIRKTGGLGFDDYSEDDYIETILIPGILSLINKKLYHASKKYFYFPLNRYDDIESSILRSFPQLTNI